MFKQLRKDFILNKRILAINAAILLGWNLYFISNDIRLVPYLGLNSIGIALAIALVPFTREDQGKTGILSCSLPSKRETLVSARFLFAILTVPAGLTILLLMAKLAPFSRVIINAVSALEVLAATSALGIAVVILAIPFTLKFGRLGLIMILLFFQVLGVLLVLAATLCNQRVNLRAMVGKIASALASLKSFLGHNLYQLLLVTILVLVATASLKISRRIFRRREF